MLPRMVRWRAAQVVMVPESVAMIASSASSLSSSCATTCGFIGFSLRVPRSTISSRQSFMRLERQLKIALDESRLLILGSQVLFGFQFNGIFQQQFASLSFASRIFICAGLPLLIIALALLIAPSMQHRIVERGQDSGRVLALATLCAGWALLPVAVALALDMRRSPRRLRRSSRRSKATVKG